MTTVQASPNNPVYDRIGLDPIETFTHLEEHGFVLVENVNGQRAAASLLQALGRFIPQYSGRLEHEIAYRPGFDALSYSHSANTIAAHTEAPGWDPLPAWLALYCHKQAACGGGHTDLLDGKRLGDLLDPDAFALMTDHPMFFPGPEDEESGAHTPMISTGTGREVLRFSYNLLTCGTYDPPFASEPPESALPLGRAGAQLAEQVNDIFGKHKTSILIPDDGLLLWDNQRMLHARSQYSDRRRHFTRYWVSGEG